MQEIKLGSDGMRDNAPAQTAQATQQVAQKWLANPHNADIAGNLMNTGTQHKSALNTSLMDAGARAVKSLPGVGKETDAANVASAIQTNLGLPPVIKLPKPTQVRMMRRWMRKMMGQQ